MGGIGDLCRLKNYIKAKNLIALMAKKWFARAYFTYSLKACLLHPPQPGVERSTLLVVTGLFTIKL